MTLSIAWQWLSSIHESPEVRETGAKLKITLGREVLTRNVDEWSKTVSDDVRLSAITGRLRVGAMNLGSPASRFDGERRRAQPV